MASSQETESGEIDLSEEDEEAVEHMVHYLYHLDYCEESIPEGQGSQQPSQKLQQARRRPSKTSAFELAGVEDPLLATASAVKATPSASLEQPSRTPPESITKRSTSPSTYPRSVSPRQRRVSRNRRDSGVGPHLTSQFSRLSTSSATTTSPKEWHSTVDEESEDVCVEAPDLVTHARVYALAEKYGISGLKELAKEKFEVMANESWEESGYLEAMHEVYTTTVESDRGLRNVVVQAFRRNPDLVRRDEVQRVVQHTAPLAWDLYRVSSGLPLD